MFAGVFSQKENSGTAVTGEPHTSLTAVAPPMRPLETMIGDDASPTRFEFTNIERGLAMAILCLLVIALATDCGMLLRQKLAHPNLSLLTLMQQTQRANAH